MAIHTIHYSLVINSFKSESKIVSSSEKLSLTWGATSNCPVTNLFPRCPAHPICIATFQTKKMSFCKYNRQTDRLPFSTSEIYNRND